MPMTAIAQLKNIAAMDASKQFIDANANVKNRCFFGWVVTTLRLNQISFIKNYMNACCGANLTDTAAKVKDLINKAMSESSEDNSALITDVVTKVNTILVKAHVPAIDLNSILNPKPAEEPAPAPAPAEAEVPVVPAPTELDVSYVAPVAEEIAPSEEAAPAPVEVAVQPTEEPSEYPMSDIGASEAEEGEIQERTFELTATKAKTSKRAPTNAQIERYLKTHTVKVDENGFFRMRGYPFKIKETTPKSTDVKSQ